MSGHLVKSYSGQWPGRGVGTGSARMAALCPESCQATRHPTRPDRALPGILARDPTPHPCSDHHMPGFRGDHVSGRLPGFRGERDLAERGGRVSPLPRQPRPFHPPCLTMPPCRASAGTNFSVSSRKPIEFTRESSFRTWVAKMASIFTCPRIRGKFRMSLNTTFPFICIGVFCQ